MFDVSFSELMVIAVVALIVIGPEKLPKVARMLGHLTGRVQRYVANVKEDINREMQFEDLQKLQQEIKQSVEYSQNSILNHTQAFENTFKETAAKETTDKETIGKELPKGFQTAEFVLDHGFLDFIVDRKDLKDKLASLLGMLK